MPRTAFSNLRLGGAPLAGVPTALRRGVLALFLLSFTLVYARLWLPGWLVGTARWPEGLLLVLTAATLLASLSAQLPAQNVMLAAGIIALGGGAIHTLGALTGFPFGPFAYTAQFGPKLLEPLPWAVPFLWLSAILTARGVARLLLRPWREGPNYGFWLLGVSVALVVLLDLSLEPFATQVQQYWVWHPTRLKREWYSAPCVNFLGWALAAFLVLAFVTPALLNKKPAQHPPQYQPLLVWALLNCLLATSAGLHHFWAAFWLTVGSVPPITALALRSAGQQPGRTHPFE